MPLRTNFARRRADKSGLPPTVRQPNGMATNAADGRVFVSGRAGVVLLVLDP